MRAGRRGGTLPKTILLIDGDQYLHRGCAAVEHEAKWDDENHVLYSNAVEAWEVVEGSIKKLLSHFDTKDYILALTEGAPGGFRKALVDPTYKDHRKDTRKPLCFFELKDRMKAEYECRGFDGLEADDVMGILSTKPGPDTKIIISRDKDMRTIPGKLWTGGTFYNVTEEEADYFHLYQTLIGDTSDGYKGCPGVGPVKAKKLLETMPGGAINPEIAHVEWMWGLVVEAYAKAGLTEADALQQARLARILRWSDWDAKKREPKLWSPTGSS